MSKQTSTKSPQEYPEWINCGNETDAYRAYLAMFRYAFGRPTHMPDTVISIIKANAARLTLRTLKKLGRELAEAERCERHYKGTNLSYSNYGTEYHRQLWIDFHAWVKEQINLHLAGNPAGSKKENNK